MKYVIVGLALAFLLTTTLAYAIFKICIFRFEKFAWSKVANTHDIDLVDRKLRAFINTLDIKINTRTYKFSNNFYLVSSRDGVFVVPIHGMSGAIYLKKSSLHRKDYCPNYVTVRSDLRDNIVVMIHFYHRASVDTFLEKHVWSYKC